MNLFLLLLGILLTSIGLMFILLYTNLLTMGYSFFKFVYFISRRLECWYFVIGIILIILVLERWHKHVLLLRHPFKLF